MTGRTHGLSGHPLHPIWKSMRHRCTIVSDTNYPKYGARGITSDPSWESFPVFLNWALENDWQPGLSLERYDVNGNYCPENCGWETPTVQARNTRRTFWVTAFGETKCLADWADDPRAEAPYHTIKSRIYAGWDTETAITLVPIPGRNRR